MDLHMATPTRRAPRSFSNQTTVNSQDLLEKKQLTNVSTGSGEPAIKIYQTAKVCNKPLGGRLHILQVDL